MSQTKNRERLGIIESRKISSSGHLSISDQEKMKFNKFKSDFRNINNLLFKSGRPARIINLITIYRIVTFPFLLILILKGYVDIFKWLLFANFFTDAIDGFLARKFQVTTDLGSRLDSLGDDLTALVAIIGLFIIKPEFLQDELLVIVLLFGLYFIELVLSLVKYGKTSSFHTYSAKVATFLQGAFLLSAFFFKEISYSLFYLTALFTALNLIEEIILVIILPQWKTNVKGLFWVLNK